MDIVIGTHAGRVTAIDTEERVVAIAPDKCDRVTLVLGINRVDIEYIEGTWTLSHSKNVATREVSRDDPKAFVELGANLGAL